MHLKTERKYTKCFSANKLFLHQSLKTIFQDQSEVSTADEEIEVELFLNDCKMMNNVSLAYICISKI